MTLKTASTITVIVGTIFTIAWSIWTYNKSETEPPTSSSSLTSDGHENILIQGNNNHIDNPLPSALHKTPNPDQEITRLKTGMSQASLQAQLYRKNLSRET